MKEIDAINYLEKQPFENVERLMNVMPGSYTRAELYKDILDNDLTHKWSPSVIIWLAEHNNLAPH